MASAARAIPRALLGEPLRSDRLEETLLPKRLALPVFCSDPLSSVAYATEQIILVLGLGGLALLYLTPWVAAAVVLLLTIVIASYRQTCEAYPNGGGAYAVSRANLGENASLTAASALLIDYVLTVAVSVVAGVAAITSAVPSLAPYAVELSLGFVLILVVANLRGVKESGRAFALPTYGFVACVLAMLAVGAIKVLFGDGLSAESAGYELRDVADTSGVLVVFLFLRAFASGCTALTGVEAVSNGVPAFEEPKSRNAATTLVIMGALSITMFAGITALAIAADVHMAEDAANLIGLPAGEEQRTAISQVGLAAFGDTAPFYLLQAFTAADPDPRRQHRLQRLPGALIAARSRQLPPAPARQPRRPAGVLERHRSPRPRRGAFDRRLRRERHPPDPALHPRRLPLVHAQPGGHGPALVAAARDSPRPGARRLHRKRIVNGAGAIATALVFVIVLVTKFSHGAWIVVIAAPILFLGMKAVSRHYSRMAEQLAPGAAGVSLPERVHTVVLVSNLLAPTLRALAVAQATHSATLRAVNVATDGAHDPLPREWEQRGVPVPLVVIESPYRETVRPVVRYVRQLRRENPGDVISIVIPEYVVAHWWENLLHNQTALRLKGRLLFEPSVAVTSVPWALGAEREAGAGLG